MTKGINSAAEQAEQLKQDGNLYFKKNRLGAAIDAYTEVYVYYICIYFTIWCVIRLICLIFYAHNLFDEMPVSIFFFWISGDYVVS